MSRRPPWNRAWLVLLCASALFACRDRSGPTDPDFEASVEVSFEVAAAWAALFDAQEVDGMRARALDASTGETLGTVAADWDPDTDAWSVEVAADLDDTGPVDVVVEVELLGASEALWSARSAPTPVEPSATPVDVALTLYRGPLANLTVTGVDVTGAPGTLEEGATAQLAAELSGSDPDELAEARVFWSSADPAVASVDVDGLVTAAGPGSASVLAVAGPAGDTVVVTVTVVPTAVLIDPPSARLTSLAEQLTVQGTVVDARGDTLMGYTLAWASTDSAVLEPVGTGVFEAAGGGQAEIVAGVVGYPDAEGRAAVEVSQEVATVTLSADTVGFAALGDQQALTLVAEDAGGTPVAGIDADWNSSDTLVATVDDSGLVTAAGNGSAEITVRVSAAALAAVAAGGYEDPWKAPGMDTVTVSAVVEVDQVATVVTVVPTDTLVVIAGPQVQFSAEASDANGHAIADAVFQWSSTDGGVASVDGNGLASTLDAGVTSIEAQVDGVSAGGDVTVLAPAGFTSVWMGGNAAAPDAWSNRDNWFPTSVPTVTDTVLVRAAASDQPRLTTDRSVATLVVQGGATLELDGFQLTVTDDLDAGSTITGPGTVRIIGTGVTVEGAMPELVVHGALVVSGPLSVTGDLTVEGAGSALDVGPHPVSATGALVVQDDATLAMSDPAGLVAVDGQAIFDGASTLGLLTAGELRVGGNFTAWTSGPLNYAPTGAHRTVLDGDVIQALYLHFNGPGESRFQSLEIDNPGGVSLQSTVRVTGDLTLTSGTLTGSQTVVLDGDLIETGEGNQYQVLNTTFTGSPALPASLQTHATFTGSYAGAADLTLVGDLTVSGTSATFDVGPSEVSVTGQMTLSGGATLVMQDAAGALAVEGEVFFNGGSTLGLLTAGELRVGGAFTAWASHPESFAPTGTHRTVLDGSSAQSVYLQHSGPGESRFHDLEIDNAAGVTLLSTTRVTNDLVLTKGTLAGSQTVFVGGDLTEVVGGNQYQVLNTTLTGSPTLPVSLQTNVTVAGAYALAQELEVIGDVFVEGAGAALDVGANTLTVSGAFRTAAGGTLIMRDPSTVLDVAGEVEFNGGSTLGLLTDGELRLAGNFTAWTSDPENFAPTGAHLTTFDGTSAQTVYLYHSGAGQGRFEDVTVDNPAGVSFLGTTRVTDELTVATALTVGLGQTTLVAGLFTLEAAATLTNNGSLQANACSLLGTVIGNAPVCP